MAVVRLACLHARNESPELGRLPEFILYYNPANSHTRRIAALHVQTRAVGKGGEVEQRGARWTTFPVAATADVRIS